MNKNAMNKILSAVSEGNFVYVYCVNGTARKIYHAFADVNLLSSVPAFNNNFANVYLFKCNDCGAKGYRERIKFNTDGYQAFTREYEYPSFLDVHSTFWTSYDDYVNGYITRCYNCDDELLASVDSYGLVYDYDDKNSYKMPNSVLIYDKNKISATLAAKFNRHRKRRKPNKNTVDDLESKIIQLECDMVYEIVPARPLLPVTPFV